ncbi:MAG: LamG domain-containing protein [Opitutaceae bacterium]|nr:LamG domain-containing protein [Opitutaceae bacterium]
MCNYCTRYFSILIHSDDILPPSAPPLHRQPERNWLTLALWLNGEKAAETLIKTGAPLMPASGLNIGTWRAADWRWFNGLIDELVLWDRALSATETATLRSTALNPPL